MPGESPTDFNNEPDAGSQALVRGVETEMIMNALSKINWKDVITHIGLQALAVGGSAMFAYLSKVDYSAIGPTITPLAQGAAALVASIINRALRPVGKV